MGQALGRVSSHDDSANYGKYMNDLGTIAQQVWACTKIEDKRNLLRRAVESFKYKGKSEQFLKDIANASAEKLDFMASNLTLNKTDKVVSLLKR